jgi:3-methylcrotonyl-CoA carboxylase beta subunit
MKKSRPDPKDHPKRLRHLTEELKQLEAKLCLGGGPQRIERQHRQGKLSARERVGLLLDGETYTQELGLLVAYDQYDGAAPAAGVVTVLGRSEGR